MSDLRAIFPTQIVRGALLRSDGIAVGLVSGGAPSWDLLSRAARGQAGDDYHRLLLALDTSLDVYLVDQPPDMASEIDTLLERQDAAEHPLLAAILSEMADYLTELARHSGSRAKQVIWAVTSDGDASTRGVGGLDLGSLIGRNTRAQDTRARRGGSRIATTALTQASERARRLADALGQLGSTPAPRLLEAEEIARLIYGLADPVRAQRYPLSGMLLDRVRRVVTPTQPT
ncbi:MAG: hypothetical protein ACJ8CR_23365 [Roseiflexaceae bacterium]